MQQAVFTPLSSVDRAAGMALTFRSVSDMYAGFGKLVELNLQTLKTSIAEQQALLGAALSAQSLGDAIEIQSQIVPATLKKQHAYWRHVGEILAQTQSEVMGGFSDYAERAGSAVTGEGGQAHDGPVLVLPAELAGAEGASEASAGAAPVSLVDSTGNTVSPTGPGGKFN